MSQAILEEDRGRTRILSINVPQRRNSVSLALREQLCAALVRAEQEANVRCVILTGVDGNFCAGGDITDMHVTDLAAGRERMRRSHRLIRQMVGMSKPLIAAVEGWAAGAGLSLAMACDTVVAGAGVRFVASFGQVGLMADMGVLHTLTQRIGRGRARQVLLYGEKWDATQADKLGLIDHLVPVGQALEVALGRAQVLEKLAPLPLALTKAVLAEGLDAQLDRELELQSQLFLSRDHAEGKAAFLGKRPAEFTGA
ncbi:enoyl-CoA hydratase-related protein [Pseudomonas sp. MWU16-30317]|uniref:enoyl-CoA hydratase/isomerase family protein n=1 Tax=Pseudomonas sp. MWU16-30317 TaxID=2878095 RepID=UPI001CF9D6F1|nr:enoyl-CoA hydratase-related protein [Pseudomonas sp. MWU16-30317]